MSIKKTIVIKIGTSSLTMSSGDLSKDKLRRLANLIADVYDLGHQVLLVTSGAIAAGYTKLGYKERPSSVAAKQASAAVGQVLLMEEYTKAFSERGIVAAQLLLTRDDFRDKRRYTNAYNALEVLLSRSAIPIINENDSVSIAELKLGDNDMLSAQLAAMIHADLLILSTDTDGLYTANPKTDKTAKHIPFVEKVTTEIENLGGSAGTKNATGGMATKISAAKLATSAGVSTIICSSMADDVFVEALNSSVRGTYFKAQKSMRTKLQWMAFYAPSEGTVYVDRGAAKAVNGEGHSLLPAGVRAVHGEFQNGALVDVVLRESGEILGRGVTNYSSQNLREVMGMSTSAIAKLYKDQKPEVIHRDNYVKLSEEVET